MTNAYVPEPTLELRDGTPISAGFDDVYFSRGGGVAETEHVFLRGNGLLERWANFPSNGDVSRVACGEPAGQGSAQRRGQGPLSSRFTIAELGFGTGLNFLVAWKKFRETAPKDAVLHFISVEKFPFKLEQLRALLALQPKVAAEAELLLANYPLRLPGMHRIHLPQAVLTLYVGDVEKALAEWEQANVRIDAWFLDGFSPAKNPDMWDEEVLSQIGKLSGPGTTFATFTAAGAVKRGLEAAGFTIEKMPGFGSKREMLVGRKGETGDAGAPLPAGEATRLSEQRELSRSGEGASTQTQTTNHPHPDLQPTASGAWANPTSSAGGGGAASWSQSKSILILGAGIAGATLARALVERGFAVTVIERDDVASGASGNAAGVLFPQLTKRWTVAAAWYFTAYGFMLRQLVRWKDLDFAQAEIGMLRLPRDAEDEEQLRTMHETLRLDDDIVRWVSCKEACAQSGVELPTGAAFFPQGTWIDPGGLCRALLQHEAITLCTCIAAKKLNRADDRWHVTLESGEVLTSDYVCVTAANASAELLADYGLRLNAVGGQVSEFAASDVATELRSILCRKGYIIPCADRYLVGATYHRESDLTAVTQERHAENIAELAGLLPGWFNGNVIGGRSSVRATTPDRLPYVGAVDAGLYVSAGHGSRGMLSAPLAAEIIAAEIGEEMPPVSIDLREAVRPLRFKRP